MFSAEDGQSIAEAIQIVFCRISIKTTPGFSTFRRKDVENPGVLLLQAYQLLALVSFTILAAGSLLMAELLRVLAIWAP